jgi:hypothetical protein
MWLLSLVSRIWRRGTAPAGQLGATAPPVPAPALVPASDVPATVTPAPVVLPAPTTPPDPRAATRPDGLIGLVSDILRDTGQTIRLIAIGAFAVGGGYVLLHTVHLHSLTAEVALGLIASATSIVTALIRGGGGRADESEPPAARPDPATPPTGDDRPDD